MVLNKLISRRVCGLLLFAGFSCMAAFRILGSTIDSEGFLHEPFALIPIGYLFIALGIFVGFLYLIRAFYRYLKSQ